MISQRDSPSQVPIQTSHDYNISTYNTEEKTPPSMERI